MRERWCPALPRPENWLKECSRTKASGKSGRTRREHLRPRREKNPRSRPAGSPHTAGDRPVAQPDRILHIGSLFKIRTGPDKGEGSRAGIQNSDIDGALRVRRIVAVGHDVVEVF